MKKIYPPKKTYINSIYIDVSGCCRIGQILELIPKDINPNDVYFSIESGFLHRYDESESNYLEVYYKGEIENLKYNEELLAYNKYVEKESFYEENKSKYFKEGEVIYLPVGAKYWLDDIEISPLKESAGVTINKVSNPISSNISEINWDNWCQVVHFTLNGKVFNTILNSVDVLFRKKWT